MLIATFSATTGNLHCCVLIFVVFICLLISCPEGDMKLILFGNYVDSTCAESLFTFVKII